MRPPEPPCDVAAAADPVAAVLRAHASGQDIALRTSGTTGAGRRVVRTTRSWVDSFPTITELTGTTPRSRVWLPGPLTSTMNLFAAVHAGHVGATVVPNRVDATHAHLTPAVLARLIATRADLRGLHLVVAGDGLTPALADAASDAGARVSHYYGAAELSFVAWGGHADDLRPLLEVEVEARGGELWVRSPYLCEGYDGPPGDLRTADGWATVGDRGGLVDGRLRVLGRGSRTITTAGVTVRLADVESALRPAARGELVAVGAPHPDLGHVLAVVLTDPDDLDRVRTASRDGLGAGERPRRWFHLPTLPLTPAGKVDHADLARQLSSSTGAARRLDAATGR